MWLVNLAPAFGGSIISFSSSEKEVPHRAWIFQHQKHIQLKEQLAFLAHLRFALYCVLLEWTTCVGRPPVVRWFIWAWIRSHSSRYTWKNYTHDNKIETSCRLSSMEVNLSWQVNLARILSRLPARRQLRRLSAGGDMVDQQQRLLSWQRQQRPRRRRFSFMSVLIRHECLIRILVLCSARVFTYVLGFGFSNDKMCLLFEFRI